MAVPLWILLGFGAWTVLLLFFTAWVYCGSRLLTARLQTSRFPANKVECEDWYLGAMRVHASCIENLVVFGAIVTALFVSGGGSIVDCLSINVLAARVMQSILA